MNNLIITILSLAIGIAVIVLTIKRVKSGLLKKFLLTLGASLTGFPVFILLHNAVYGAAIYFFGNDFWNSGDEPVFFIIALIICPLGFLVGLIGSLVIFIKRSLRERSA